MKSYYLTYKFDSSTELDFANLLENDDNVLRWLRPVPNQFKIYWGNGAHLYEPDFIVETCDRIYMIETKAEKDLDDEHVQEKKKAAIEYCSIVNEYTKKNGGKCWVYALIPHTLVGRTIQIEYLIANTLAN